jgi:hypothetical protein
MRGAAGADRRHRVLPSRAPAYRAARAARWVAALTPLSVDGMIVAASATLLAYARASRRGAAPAVSTAASLIGVSWQPRSAVLGCRDRLGV